MNGTLPDPPAASSSRTLLVPAWLITLAGALSLALLLTAVRLAAAPRSALPVLAAPGSTPPDHGAAQAACEPQGARFTCELPATPGERLIVEIPNGVTVHVTGWDRPLVSVQSETDRAFNAVACGGRRGRAGALGQRMERHLSARPGDQHSLALRRARCAAPST